MKRSIYLFIAMALLLTLLPAVATAAPPKPPFVSVGRWTLPVSSLPVLAKLSAWDINWKVPRGASIELGYVFCQGDKCKTVVEAEHRITRDDKYPQHLDLEGTTEYNLRAPDPGEECELHQFVIARAKDGESLAGSLTYHYDICIGAPQP